MADDDRFLLPGHLIDVVEGPVQLPDRDERVRISTLAGPSKGLDTRMVLSVRELELLLDKARHSVTGRVVIPQVGIRVDLYRRPGGHQYEVWRIVGRDAVPERHGLVGGSSR